MTIRQERFPDYEKVYELVNTSFATAPHSDGTEADYLNDIRKKDTFIPELSLVTERENGEIIGQIVLYEMNITMPDRVITELVLSPICVHPMYCRKGVARKMMERSFEIAKKLGYKAVFLCGEPKLYRKLGFVPTFEYDIYHISDVQRNAEWCMVRELVSGTLDQVNGTIDIV